MRRSRRRDPSLRLRVTFFTHPRQTGGAPGPILPVMKHILVALTMLLALSAAADDVTRSLSRDPMEAAAGIAALREQGQAGVDALVAAGEKLTDAQDVER